MCTPSALNNYFAKTQKKIIKKYKNKYQIFKLAVR